MTVGTTRLSGNAGASIDITALLAGDLSEREVLTITDSITGWSYGAGANAVRIIYAGTTTLTDGGNATLDLYAGTPSLLDIFGRDLTLKSIKFLYVKNTSTDSGLTIGGSGADDLLIFGHVSDKVYIPPGGIFVWTDPSAAGVSCAVTNMNLYLLDDGTGAAGQDVDVIAMGVEYTSSSSSSNSSSSSSLSSSSSSVSSSHSSSSQSSSHSSSSSSVSSSHSSSSSSD